MPRPRSRLNPTETARVDPSTLAAVRAWAERTGVPASEAIDFLARVGLRAVETVVPLGRVTARWNSFTRRYEFAWQSDALPAQTLIGEVEKLIGDQSK